MLMKQWSNYTIVYNAQARYSTLTHPLLMRDLFLFSSAGRDTPETAGKCQPRHFADLKKKGHWFCVVCKDRPHIVTALFTSFLKCGRGVKIEFQQVQLLYMINAKQSARFFCCLSKVNEMQYYFSFRESIFQFSGFQEKYLVGSHRWMIVHSSLFG